MFIRISLIVAIAAALFVSGWNIVKVREKITTLITQRDMNAAKR
jgi:lipopolysaccharide export system protein LptC